jgi:hypothetical protein
MVKELRRISGGIQALVEVVGRLMEVVMGLGKKEVEKEDKGTETETVKRMDREVETEIIEEESESEEEEEKKMMTERKMEIRRWKRWRRNR